MIVREMLTEGKEKILVRGFLISVSTPSGSTLHSTINVSRLGRVEMDKLRDVLNDIIRAEDTAFAEKGWTRGRHLKIKWKREKLKKKGSEVRSAYIIFSPFPSSFLNKIGNIRAKVYEAINAYAMILQTMQEDSGEGTGLRRHLYLLPFTNAEMFANIMNKLDQEVEEVRQKVESFRRNKFYRQIMNVLEKYKIRINVNYSLPHIRIFANPLEINVQQMNTMLDDYYKKKVQEIDKLREESEKEVDQEKQDKMRELAMEKESALKLLQKELDTTRREMVKNCVLGLKKKFEVIVKELEEKKGVDVLVQHIEELKAMTQDIGVGTIVKDIIDGMEEIAKAEEGMREEVAIEKFGKPLHKEIIENFEDLLARI